MKKQKKRLRDIWIEELMKFAEKDRDVILLNDDTGFSLFENFAKKFPKQYFNCGITEQTIMGIAAGLAQSGKKPYVYGIIPFAIMRCYEQLRTDVCYQNRNVKVIGVGGKKYYQFLGFTHNIENDEDIKILRHLPNIKIYTPKTLKEIKKVVEKSYRDNSPAYIRL